PTIRPTTTIRKTDTFPGSLGQESPSALATRFGAGLEVDGFGVETSTGAEATSTSIVVLTWSIGGIIPSTGEASHTITQTYDSGSLATQTGQAIGQGIGQAIGQEIRDN